MRILVIGGGGREHALVWKLAQSPRVSTVYTAPGNAGTAQCGQNVPLDIRDHAAVINFCIHESIDLVVVTPDDPLAAGMVDDLQVAGIRAFGPTRAAARVESSKAFAKNLMREAHIPTAAFETFTDYTAAREHILRTPLPLVVKASGLALGKGVVICHTQEEAFSALEQCMSAKVFGAAGEEVVIEEFLEGQEFSVHALCDGTEALLFPASQDHKAIYDGDQGPNTGGMGSVAPLPWVSPELMSYIKNQIVLPALRFLAKQGSPFSGLLYPGLMMTKMGPKVLEFNARFGDPETQAYMRLLESDLLDLLEATINRKLHTCTPSWRPGAACCIVLTSAGYPGVYEKGKPITKLANAEELSDVKIFYAGVSQHRGQYATAGGRVLGVSAYDAKLSGALSKTYRAAGFISFEGKHLRRDIGTRPSPQVIF